MKKSKSLQISLLNDTDKEEIISWGEKYKGTEGLDAINRYILEDFTYYTLADVIKINYEHFPIGDDERQFFFVAKNQENEVVAWLLCDCFDMHTNKPELFVQYIAVHPLHQHEGYGKELAENIILNSKKFIGVEPKNYFAYIDNSNTASKELFKKFGFKFKRMTDLYSRAEAKSPKLEHSQNQELGE